MKSIRSNKFAWRVLLQIFFLFCLVITSTCKKLEKSMLVSTGEVTDIETNSAEVTGMVVDLGKGATQYGHCYGTASNVSTAGLKTQLGIPPVGGFTSQLTNLTAGTKYYIKAYMSSGPETVYGKEISFNTTAASLPVLTTAAITDVTATTAITGGEVTSDGGAPVTERGVCWNTSSGPSLINSKTTNGSGTGVFSSNISGLESGTKYYVRAYATTSAGTAYGNELSFTTDAATIVLPTLTTTDVTSITSTTASSGGNISSDGGAAVTARGVCWGTNTTPTTGNGNETINGEGIGSFVSSITGLEPATVYYVRAYATNSEGTAYGDYVGFTTSAVLPILSTAAVTMISQTTASSGGTITSDGGASISERGICWSISSEPTIETGQKTIDENTGTGVFTCTMTGLSAGTKYYVRAFATNNIGTAYGQEEIFTTSAAIETGTFTDIRDGTDYNWVKIGTKKWMSENLAYLPSVSPSDQSSYFEPYYYVYGYQSNDVSGAKSSLNYSVYGALYNWKAAMAGANSNDDNPGALQGVCPDGWHLPSDNEWKELEMYFGMTSTDADQTGSRGDIGGMLKEEGTDHWSSPNTGATNSSGFTALPGGHRKYDNSFFGLTYDGYWWTSTEYNVTYAYNRLVDYAFQGVNRNYPNKDQGLSVRCVEGQGILVPSVETSTTVSSVTSSSAVAGGTVTDDGGSPVTARGICWSTDHNIALGNGKETVEGTGTGTFTSTISGLSASTQYYFRAYATNSAGTRYGDEVSFTTNSAAEAVVPSITTTVITAITGFTATGGGNVTSDGGDAVTAKGVCWDINPNPTIELSTKTSDGTGSGSFISSITGLNNNTTYHVRAYATNSIGTAYGEDLTFTTLNYPLVTTTNATVITATSATTGGNVISDGGTEVTARGVCWDTSPNPAIDFADKTENGTGTGYFESNLSGLNPETLYHVRAYAINSVGVNYGDDITFTTLCLPPTGLTNPATFIFTTAATLNGTVNANGSSTIVTFEYGTTTEYGNSVAATQSPLSGAANVTVNAEITSLTPNTLYHFRVKTVNCGGTVYGSDLTFNTLCNTPTSATSAATSVLTTSATLNGTVNANNASTTVTFEYGTSTGYGSSVTADQSPVEGSSSTAVSAMINDLSANTTYHFRVKSVNCGGTTYGDDQSFTTLCFAPTATTNAATSVTSSTANLNGSVNANGFSTTVIFEYGLTTGYGSTITASQSPVTGTSSTSVSAGISGLSPGTLYHFRVKTINCGGTIYGSDRTFSTTCLAPIATTKTASGNYEVLTLKGTVNANGCNTTVTFEWSITGFGTGVVNGDPGTVTGISDTNVNGYLYDLPPGTNITYRVKAVNSAGTTYGNYLGMVIGLK